MSTRQIFRHYLPVDDNWHEFVFTGDVLHVQAVDNGWAVEFWAFHDKCWDAKHRLRLFGTGQEITESVKHHGSVVTRPESIHRLVWHLLEEQT